MLSLSRQVFPQAMHIRVPIQNFRSAQKDSVVALSCCPTKQIIIMRIRWDLVAFSSRLSNFINDSPSRKSDVYVDAKIFVFSGTPATTLGDAWEGSKWHVGVDSTAWAGSASWLWSFAGGSFLCSFAGGSWLVHGRWNSWWLGFWLLWCWLGI